MNPNYTLLPGTDQLVRRYPDQGSQLFMKHGYHIRHPRYRDYYNGMQTGGMEFFNDLAALVGGIAPLFAKKGTSGISAGYTPQLYTPPAYNVSVPKIGFNGDEDFSNITGVDRHEGHHGLGYSDMDRGRAYHELLEHLRRQAELERYLPVYSAGVIFSNGEQPEDSAPIDTSGPRDDGSILGINKKLVIGIALALVIVLYLKFRT